MTTSPKKIGIDCRMYSSSFTGIGRYTYELVKRICEANNQKQNPDTIFLFFNSPEYEKFNIDKTPNVQKVLVNANHYSFAEQTKFLKILYSHNLDIMHFTHFNVPLLYRRPYIVTIHDLTLSLFPGKKMTGFHHRLGYSVVIKNAVRHAKAIIAISNNTAKDLKEILKVPLEKVTVIYNGISPEFRKLKSIEEKMQIQETLNKYNIKQPFILYTGVWRSHKNLSNLVSAFDTLINEKKLDLNMVITGREDPHYPEIRQSINRLNLQNSIVTPGLVSETELIHLYNAARLYIFPSLYEGFGLPPLEAMQSGTPVAASNTSSIPEICGEHNAVFFNPHDPKDMAEKIAFLYQNEELQEELIKNGYIRAKQFDWDSTAQQTYELINQYV